MKQYGQAEIVGWKEYRKGLLATGIYETLYEKWDLYVAFLERAFQLLRTEGRMAFIIPDSFNGNKYASRSRAFFLSNAVVERVDFCSEIDLFDAGVNNTILHFKKAICGSGHAPARVRRWGPDRSYFDKNAESLLPIIQAENSDTIFKPNGLQNAPSDHPTLGHICYISYGLRANSDERHYRGEFITNDLVSEHKDAKHPKRFVEGKDLSRWAIKRNYYLEWGTPRSPAKLARPTFIELHEASEKLIALVVSSSGTQVVYDDCQHFTTHTSCIFVPWHLLKGVKNKSIKKTAKYKSEVKASEERPLLFRDEFEQQSRQYALKYLLGVMNSSYCATWLSLQRRSKLHLYPDDWKKLPIPTASAADKAAIAALVQKCLDAKGVGCEEWEREIDERVNALYGL